MTNSVTVPGTSTDLPAVSPSDLRKPVNLASKESPLARLLKPDQAAWLTNHVVSRYQALDQNMTDWREKMAKWERMSEEDYSDRKNSVDPVNDSSIRDIFTDQNDTLGTSAGFYDFHYAQAKDDIFGTRPWLAATPEGKDDTELADSMTKHSQWKLNQSNVEPALKDALKVSTWGGTAFVKVAYEKDIDSFKKTINAAYLKDGTAILDPDTGEYIQTPEPLVQMGITEDDMEWRNIEVDETQTVYANVTADWIDFKDISFETTARELDLRYTDVFCRFRAGLLDVMAKWKIPMEKKPELMASIMGYNDEARSHRSETGVTMDEATEEPANPVITLVEGFVRCDPLMSGKLSRIHVIFSPDLHILFAVDFLGNITPGSILPVFPVRINKLPGRVFGKGYFEKYENPNNAVDRQYNLITYRNRTNAHVFTAFNKSALKDEGEGQNITLDPTKPFELAADKTIDDLIQFKAAPDVNSRSDTLLNQMLQMIQMRSGITSAAQGELKGVPSANTATGTRDIQSRGATLVKCPISEQIDDIRKIVEYAVILIYANLDHDETFSWGEGRETTLYTIQAAKVEGIRANVQLTLVQAQNQAKLQNALTAIDIVTKYFQIPEPDKDAARPAFVQALSSVGFHNAEDIIRQAAIDPAGILAMLPPEMAAIVQQAFVQAGMIADPAAEQNAIPAPVFGAA